MNCEDEMKLCQCHNCEWIGPVRELRVELDDVPHLLQRIGVGDQVPAGECPHCGALAFLTDS